MAKQGKNNGKGPPLCGDNLTDLLFKLVIDTIHHRIATIKKKKNLTNPDEKNPKRKREALYGIYDPETREIYLSDSKCKHPTKMSMVKSLIHEVFHDMTPEIFHKRVYQFDRILETRFTDRQKKYLRNYIPKHQVKTGPRPNK